jgi:hypothetical protein
MRYAAPMKTGLFVLLTVLAALGVKAHAEVEKFTQTVENEPRPSYRLKFTPPKGWVRDTKSEETALPIYVPEGMNFSTAPAQIYIKVLPNGEKRPLEKLVELANEAWRDTVTDTKIDKRANEKRANGKAGFEVYHFTNPTQPTQAHQLIAYGEDTDKDGNSYFVTIGLAAATIEAIGAAEADYRAGLRAN